MRLGTISTIKQRQGTVRAQQNPVSSHYSQEQHERAGAAGVQTMDVETVLSMSSNVALSCVDEPVVTKEVSVTKEEPQAATKAQPDVKPKAQNRFGSLFDDSDERRLI